MDWCDLGAAALTEPFFDQTVHRALSAGGRYRQTPLAELVSCAAGPRELPRMGFVFHASRCGSTWVARMLAAVTGCLAVSEPAILDALLLRARPDEPSFFGGPALRGAVTALAHSATPPIALCVIKATSRAAEDIPVLEAAFPDARWIFLYRDPCALLASLAGASGDRLPPGLAAARLVPGDPAALAHLAPAEFWARVLARRFETAGSALAAGRGRLVHYAELPAAVATRVLPWFGATASPADLAAMDDAARFDAKRPSVPFARDAAALARRPTPQMRALVERLVLPAYEALEARRRADLG